MGFLAIVASKLLEFILEKGGHALYAWTVEFVARKKEEAANKKNLDNLNEAVKKGDDDEILKRETDLLNGQ
jgi:hypothetical protein